MDKRRRPQRGKHPRMSEPIYGLTPSAVRVGGRRALLRRQADEPRPDAYLDWMAELTFAASSRASSAVNEPVMTALPSVISERITGAV
jgi:hypothetical protein